MFRVFGPGGLVAERRDGCLSGWFIYVRCERVILKISMTLERPEDHRTPIHHESEAAVVECCRYLGFSVQ